MNIRRGVAIAVCALCSAPLLGAQDTPPAPQDGPAVTFRSAIDAVQIDVMVTDADGNPVSGLTADDFELIENGKPQPITTFEAVNIPIERDTEGVADLAEPDVQSNDGPLGRVYLFALDEVLEESALRTRHFLRQFMDQNFGPHDVAAVVSLGRDLASAGQDFTSNRRLLLSAIDRFSGGFEHPRLKNARTSGRSQQMASLRLLIESIARIPGRHKAMLLFTSVPEIDMLDIVDYNGGVLGLAGEDAHASLMAATRSNLRIYPIDPAGLTPDHVPLDTQASMRALGQVTGGFALVNSNSFTETFERIVRDNSVYYMLGFNSGYEKNNGKYVRVQVKVKKPDLVVHAREGYMAPTRDERRAKERVEPPASAVEAGLASPLNTSAVRMRVSALPFKGSGKNATVALTVDINAASLDLTTKNDVHTGDFDIRYLATDAAGKVYPEVRHRATVKIDPRAGVPATSLDSARVRVVTRLELPRGRYQLRVAVGTQLHAGNVVYDLEVPDFRDDSLALSGVALLSPTESQVLTLQPRQGPGAGRPVTCRGGPCITTLEAAGAAPSAVDAIATGPLLQGLLPASPTTVREFTANDQLVLAVEAYDNRRTERNADADSIELRTELRGMDEGAVRTITEGRSSTAPRTPSGAHAFQVRVSLEGVPAGAYVIYVEARSARDPRQAAMRRVPIRVR